MLMPKRAKYRKVQRGRMTGVASALETDDDVRLLGQHVCNLTFTLVAPVDPHDRAISHIHCLLVCVHFKQRLIIRAGAE